jgi:hypothetical protein
MHATNVEAQRNERRAESRGVYLSATWKRLRLLVLSESPWCEWRADDGRSCPMPAEEVDHVVPIQLGGERYARGNLQALCKRHHSMKTAKESGFGGAAG